MATSEPIKIIADAAETRSGIISLLQKLPGYEIEVRTLDSGDYQVGENCIIERKRNVDLFSSILDGRFISQAKLMAESFSRVIYIIEGNLGDVPHGFSTEAIHGAISFLSVLEGISVIPSRDTAETASLVATMARHCQQGLGYVPPLRVSKPKGGDTSKLFIIEGLPACGGKRARDILAHFGTVAKVFTAKREDWMQIKGLGQVTVDKILSVI